MACLTIRTTQAIVPLRRSFVRATDSEYASSSFIMGSLSHHINRTYRNGFYVWMRVHAEKCLPVQFLIIPEVFRSPHGRLGNNAHLAITMQFSNILEVFRSPRSSLRTMHT